MTETVDFYALILDGLYSDFEVIVAGKSYKLHKALLSRCSGFFDGLFRTTPNESQVEFDQDHLLSRNAEIWDELVALWYKKPNYRRPCHDPHRYPVIIARYIAVCQYLSVEIPKVRFLRGKSFLPADVKVVYNGKANTLSVLRKGFSDQCWENAKTLVDDQDTYSNDLPMEPTMIQAVLAINQHITRNTCGCCRDLLKTLSFIQVRSPKHSYCDGPTIQINGCGYGTHWHDQESVIDITDDIENYLRQTLPHTTFW